MPYDSVEEYIPTYEQNVGKSRLNSYVTGCCKLYHYIYYSNTYVIFVKITSLCKDFYCV